MTPSSSLPRRILIVDDEPVLRRALRRMLVDAGWDVREAASTDGAVENLEMEAFAAVLIESHTPGRAGAEAFVRAARFTHPSLTLLVTCASPGEAMRRTFAQAGADRFLDKVDLGSYLLDVLDALGPLGPPRAPEATRG